jgi:ribonuclease E
MPSSGSFGGGVSRKITDFAERRRLKAIVDKITTASSASVIIRTIARGRSEEEIAADYHYLADLWNQIREKTLKSVAPVFIHAEDDMLKKLIRDMYGNDIGEIIIQGESTFLEAKKVAIALEGPEKINITEYKGSIPIFAKYGVAREIASLYSPVVNLQSGAYIVINHTEALIAIDVNSGKLTSEKNVEETAFKTNLEAATEIARQIKLRDLAGLIVIDFIDMIESSSRKHVERVMRDLLYSDKAKVQIGRISEFGLLEMTRQRLKPNFLEYNTVTCNHCRGKGVIRSYESSSINILKTLEMELSIGSNFSTLKLYAAPETVMHLLNYKKSELCALEQKYNTQIIVFQDARMSAEGFAVEKLKKNKMNNRPVQNVGQTHTDRPKNNSQNHQFIENNQRNSSKDNIQNTIVNKGHNQLKESQVNEAPEKKEEPNLVSKSELNEESSLKNEKSVDSIEISNNDEQEKVQSLSEFESIVNLDKAIKKKKYRKNRFKQKKHFRKTMENVPETKD